MGPPERAQPSTKSNSAPQPSWERSQQRHQVGAAGEMEEEIAPVAVLDKALEIAGGWGLVQEQPPDERVEPRVDPVLEPARLNLVRQRPHLPPARSTIERVGGRILVGTVNVLQRLAMVLRRKHHDATLNNVRLP